jgi:glycosyltransferase involved in cell wall biosynthesis
VPRVCHLSTVHRALDGRIFYREARTLVRAGYDVNVVAIHPRDEVIEGVRILGLAEMPRARRPLLWRTLLARAIATNAALFHIHDPELLALVPLLRLGTGCPVIYDVHEANPDFVAMKLNRFGPLGRSARRATALLEPQLARSCAGIVAADERIMDGFAGLDQPGTVLYNYPTREFVARADVSSVADRPPLVIHLGTHTVDRGALLMIEAFAHVYAGCPEARLLLVGPFHPPGLADILRARVAAAGLARAITIMGRIPFAEVGGYLHEAAVGWIPLQATPKYQKNIPTKLFEYMTYGLPVVSSDLTPVRPYLRDGEAGLLAASASPEAHGAALLALLRNAEEAAAMGRAGRRLVEDGYNWAAMEPRLLALYEAVLARQ